MLARCLVAGSALLCMANVALGGAHRPADALSTSVLDLHALSPASRTSVNEALARIRRGLDPCGESRQVAAVLDELTSCPTARYAVRTSPGVGRNLFDRPIGPEGETLPRTIVWNPDLRSELERGCDGDPDKPVARDPTASLLHELVHALQDCRGLNPGEHELDAVRIENIYRRAAGLCQRTGYGDIPLHADTVRTCGAASCPCSIPYGVGATVGATPRGDSARRVSGDAEPAR